MRFGHFEIFVSDPLASKEFYVEALGFELEEVQGGQFVWLSNGGVSFLLRPGRQSLEADTYQGAAGAIVLYTDRLEETVATLVANGVVLRGRDGSECCYTFTDPDGNWFQLVDPAGHG